MMRAKIAAVARAVPERVLTNSELEKMVDTTDEWIVERTGIRQRHILAEGLCTSDLAAEAGRRACKLAGVEPSELDAIMVGTVTPDMAMPATATWVQAKLGAGHCPAFDLSAACAGFIYGLTLGDALIRIGSAKRILVIGVEILSRFLDWKDRGTCVLFGDGAGAAVLVPGDGPSGLLGCEIHSDGAQACHLTIPGGGTVNPTNGDTVEKKLHYVHMNGRQIFSLAVRNMSAACTTVLERCGYAAGDVTTVFAHQANLRILDGVAQRVGLPSERFFNNIERYGNTSSASIPIAMSEAFEQGRIQQGDLLLLTALGAGVSWGAALVRW
ncbi:MAG: ketoacyl-ACP synthase III [Deltaproteobacteria bacterium]|nr:ketoacyl-ACP synthase III [Deltaproteobacteria bacterium]